jgi:hypothetical protein
MHLERSHLERAHLERVDCICINKIKYILIKQINSNKFLVLQKKNNKFNWKLSNYLDNIVIFF